MADGEVLGDARELRQMLADCAPYLKDGETPAQRIERERRDTEAALTLLIREKNITKQLREQLAATPAPAPQPVQDERAAFEAWVSKQIGGDGDDTLYSAYSWLGWKARAALAATPAPAQGSWVSADDVDRLARDLDVAMNGEEGAAQRPALCDVVPEAVKRLAATSAPAPQWTPEAVARTLALAEELRNKIKAKPEDEAGQGKEASNAD